MEQIQERVAKLERGLSEVHEVLEWPFSDGTLLGDKVAAAKRACQRYHDACYMWETITREKVRSLADLERPFNGRDLGVSLKNDPWGRPYWLERTGEKFRVCSAGPDGQPGTPDDIAYVRK